MTKHHAVLRERHKQALVEVTKLKALEARINHMPVPPENLEQAKKLDGLLAELQVQHQTVQAEVANVRAANKALIDAGTL